MDKPVEAMTEQALRDFVFEEICTTPQCYNIPASGITLCTLCAGDEIREASIELVCAKKRLDKEFPQ